MLTLDRSTSQNILRSTLRNYSHRIRQRSRQVVLAQAAVPGPLYLGSSSSERRILSAAANFSTSFIPFPFRDDPNAKRTPPLVRVRLTVHYRVHSRQMLCVGGSAIPFGWSFLSIAKVPMSWQPTDIWVVDVELPAGARVEYKYVVLEQQDWTRQVNELSEGRVDYTYRVAPDFNPPDVQTITKQMAIVAWQSGSNRVLQVPDEAELALLKAGAGPVNRPLEPSGSSLPSSSFRAYGKQAIGNVKIGPSSSSNSSSEVYGAGSGSSNSMETPAGDNSVDEDDRDDLDEVWERLSIDDSGRYLLERRDVWGRGESPHP